MEDRRILRQPVDRVYGPALDGIEISNKYLLLDERIIGTEDADFLIPLDETDCPICTLLHMKRNISSKWTLPVKILNFLLAVVPLVSLIASYRELESDTLPIRILVIALVAVWSLFFLWINYRLKFASVDEKNIYVSRLFREKTIPLSEIEDVSLTTIGFVWVRVCFRSKTEFGSQIFFLPTIVKSFILSFQRFHPIVEELKQLSRTDL